MASTPLFSIVIPVYNSAKTIRECLESIVTQSFPDFEVIIVNDGSTDETEKIVKSFSENDSRIKLYSFPNENDKIKVTKKGKIKTTKVGYFFDCKKIV